MVDGAEFQGKTVADAIHAAEAQLGAGRDELEIEILTQGRGGVFGIGAEPARVRARPKSAPAPEPEPVQETVSPTIREPENAASAGARAPVVERESEQEAAVVTAEQPSAATEQSPNGTAELLDEASDVLRQLLATMGFNAQVSVRSRQDPIMLAITGENLGVLIGRRGDNLAALQFMVNLILSKNRRQWPRIVVDVENYRARREESLKTLAERIAYRVQRNGRPFTLEAMPAGDRRVIHLTLRDRSDIETYSIGEGAARRVVIAPKRASHGGYSRY